MKSYKQFLTELTKGEKLGYRTKISINEYVKEHLDITQDNIPGTDVKNSFTSFRDINKLGINPKSKYKTPNGLYCYPNQYVYAVIGDENPATKLPFLGDSEYAYLFPVKASKEKQIIHLQTMTKSEEQKLYKKIKTLLKKKYPKLKIHEQLDDIIKKSNEKNGARYETMPAGRFWYVTMIVAELINKGIGGTHPVQWSKLFMDIGIYGFIDMALDNHSELADIDKRYGIIHMSEPTQAVFFDTSVVDKSDNKKYKSVYNKHSEEHVLAKQVQGEKIAKDKAKVRSITNYDELRKEICRNPMSIKYVRIYNIDKIDRFKEFMKTKPSAESAKKYKTELVTDLQLIAVKKNVYTLRYIEYPTYEVEQFIIDNASHMIATIKNMSTEAQIYAIEKKFTNITRFSKITDGTINYILNNYVNDKNKKEISDKLNYHYIDKSGREKLRVKFDAKFGKEIK